MGTRVAAWQAAHACGLQRDTGLSSAATLSLLSPTSAWLAGRRQSVEELDEVVSAARARDRRRRTNVLMEDMGDADQGSTVHFFLTPELAARSALFRG